MLMPKNTNKAYYLNNKPVNIFNIIQYLCYMKTYGIIPEFNVFNDIDNLYIETCYTNNCKWNKEGISLIKYNIYTKKWTSIIDHIKYQEIYEKYYYLIENDMIKVNYNHPYVEYELESDYFEDILEPSLNSFNDEYINDYRIQLDITPRNFIKHHIEYNYNNYNNYIMNIIRGIQAIYDNMYNEKHQTMLSFYQKYNKHEQYLNFKACIQVYTDNNLILPQEIWDNIYKLFI
jgi:hypothetical protein